jgi:peptide methionine sulfoxide reductase msrA/msrB
MEKHSDLKKKLSKERFHVMCEEGTEPPFQNAYWDNKRPGIYVDPITGDALFSSADKFDSGTGWPSFVRPIDPDKIEEKPDNKIGMIRTEVRSKGSDTHLGHVFPDGPEPAGTRPTGTRFACSARFARYCINSASLRFISVEEMEKEGYAEYLKIFESGKAQTETAAFGAGCFWHVEAAFGEISGVVKTRVGFMGGHTQSPTYANVCTHSTGHAEVVEVTFDPRKISYRRLVEIFFQIHDPTTINRQGADIGDQYRSVIFYSLPEQQQIAESVKAELEKSGQFKRPIVTRIMPVERFWQAEEYHQQYLEKNGITSCRR